MFVFAKNRRRVRSAVQLTVGISLVGAVLLGGFGDASAAVEPDGIPGKKLVFNARFDDGVNTKFWNVRNNQYSDNERSCDTDRPTNVSTSGGYLILHAKPEKYNCGGTMRDYTSGYLDTIGKESWQYGTFVIRAKLPVNPGTSAGLWPAFWMMPEGGHGEIDIAEQKGSGKAQKPRDAFVMQAIHHDYTGHIPQEEHWSYFTKGEDATTFHTYRMDWGPHQMLFYIDGVKKWTIGDDTVDWYDRTFQKPYNIRLNYQVGGEWCGDPDGDTDFSQNFVVDYVQVYQ